MSSGWRLFQRTVRPKMAGIVSADKSRACPCPPCFSEFRAGNCPAICSARACLPKHVVIPRRSGPSHPDRPAIMQYLNSIRHVLGQFGRTLNGRVIGADTLACARVRERDVGAWFTHENCVGRDCWLNIRPAIAIDRADNSLLDRIRHASVARVAMCRYPDHFWSPARVQDQDNPFLTPANWNLGEEQ